MEAEIGLLLTIGAFGRISIDAVMGRKRLSPFSSELPSSLRQLTKKAYSYESMEEGFIEYLLLHGDVPIWIDIKGQTRRFAWDGRFTGEGKTFFRNSGSEVELKRSVVLKVPRPGLIRIGKRLLLDLTAWEMGYVSDVTGWEPWYDLFLQSVDVKEGDQKGDNKKKLPSLPIFDELSIPLKLPFEKFNKYQSENIGLQNHFIMEDYQESAPVMLASSPKYQVKVVCDRWDNQATLSVLGSLDGHELGMDRGIFSCYEAVQKKYLQAIKKPFYVLMADVSMEALLNPEWSVSEHLSALALETFPQFDAWINQIRKGLDSYRGKKESKLFLQDKFLAQYELDFDRESELLMLLLIHLGDMAWSYDSALRISVPYDTLLQRIEALNSAFKASNVVLVWDDKPVEVRRLEIRMSVKHRKDWFTLHPEILINGKQLSPELIKKLSESNGSYVDGDQIIVLTRKSQAMLKQLNQVMETNTKKKAQIVKLNRLQVLDVLLLREMGAEINLPKKFEYLFKLSDQERNLTPRKIPATFNGELREYQKEGYYWMAHLYEYGFGGCLADDMGLGKTVQTLVFLSAVREGIVKSSFVKGSQNPILIIVPPSLKFVWMLEVEKFFPEMTCCDYGIPEEKEKFQDYDLLFVTYDLIRRDIDWFARKYFSVAVFDEAQLIKNIYTGRAAAVRKLKVGFKLCLTGTPIENHLGEYYSILDLAVPGLLEDYDKFQSYVKQQEGTHDYSRLVKRTSPFVLRRIKADILPELPEKTEQNILLDMSDAQKKLYKRIVTELRTKVNLAYDSDSKQSAQMTALTAILRLRQLCVAPTLIEPTFKERSPKVSYLLDHLRELCDEGHCALIFSQFRQFLDVLEAFMIEEKLPFVRMDGRTPVSKRKKLVESFQNSPTPVFFLISLKTGGLGLNLTRASYVFHLDPWWNPSVEDQASDRVYRIGQTQKVFINRLIMKHSVEEKIMLLKEEKRVLFTEILDKGIVSSGVRQLTKSDFDFLISE